MIDPKLQELTNDGAFRGKVQLTLQSLVERGEKPKIFEAMRTVEQQREKVKKGYSKTMRSYHLKRGKDGKGLAADIADARNGWNASKRFWFLLGANCEARDLGWGGLFGLGFKQRRALEVAINELRKAGWPQSHEAYQAQLGWDVAHVEFRSNW